MANKPEEVSTANANDVLSEDAVKLSLESKSSPEDIAQAEKFKDEGNAAFKGFLIGMI